MDDNNTERSCVKSISLGNNTSYCYYLRAYGPTLYIEPKLGLLATMLNAFNTTISIVTCKCTNELFDICFK